MPHTYRKEEGVSGKGMREGEGSLGIDWKGK